MGRLELLQLLLESRLLFFELGNLFVEKFLTLHEFCGHVLKTLVVNGVHQRCDLAVGVENALLVVAKLDCYE